MKWMIPTMDWAQYLAEAVRDSLDGDVIVVRSHYQKIMAEKAKARIAPEKNIKFEMEENQEQFED